MRSLNKNVRILSLWVSSIFLSVVLVISFIAFSSNIATAQYQFTSCVVAEEIASNGGVVPPKYIDYVASVAEEAGYHPRNFMSFELDEKGEPPTETVFWFLIPIGIILIMEGCSAGTANPCDSPPGGDCSPGQASCTPYGGGHCIYTCVAGPGGTGYYQSPGIQGPGICP